MVEALRARHVERRALLDRGAKKGKGPVVVQAKPLAQTARVVQPASEIQTAPAAQTPPSSQPSPQPVRVPAPRAWLVVKLSSVLASVAVTNFVCYGGQPVPRFGQPVLPAAVPKTGPPSMTLAFTVRAADGSARLACPEARLDNLQTDDRKAIWSGFDAARRMQVIWVWDFFRILSYFALRVALPEDDPPQDDAHAAWRETIEAVRAMLPGDTVLVDVVSGCGDIHQTHTLEQPAYEWVPQQE
jgi:hypothetical protein